MKEFSHLIARHLLPVANLSHPLAKGLIAFTCQHQLLQRERYHTDMLRGRKSQYTIGTGTPNWVLQRSSWGDFQTFSQSASVDGASTVNVLGNHTTTTSCTYAALITSHGTATAVTHGRLRGSTQSCAAVVVGDSSTAVIRALFNDSVPTAIFASTNWASATNKSYFVVARYQNGVGLSLFVDGTLQAFTANTNALSNAPTVHEYRGGGTNVRHPPITFSWSRALSDGEIGLLSENPWALIARRQIYHRRMVVASAASAFKPYFANQLNSFVGVGVA